MMSGRRSPAGAAGAPGVGGAVGGARVPGAVGGTPGATVPTRPLAKSWFRMFARSAASAKRIGMICNSSCPTCTSTSRMMSRSRRRLDAVSVMMSTFVSRWAMRLPRGDFSEAKSVERSATEE